MSLTSAEAPASIFARLEPLLARVSKPIQYVGGSGFRRKGLGCRRRLAVPELSRRVRGWFAESTHRDPLRDLERAGLDPRRAHLSGLGDLEALMREHGVPQFTLESHRPVAAFDVLEFSFATESTP